ncbi:hypothetical protein [Candidatus Wolbachia massiliensis]|uniref:Uncharacterized protein n=2 Tax=Candidatus Wolbachia massiliensis TaxID=1845000 RepID=A0A7M3U331_9RICK|nr:hypothetical protein ID128_01845 [Candidatus Wolbachia massiliensis]
MNVPVINSEGHLDDNIDLSKREVVTLEAQKSTSDLGKKNDVAGFDIPLSIFQYKGYNFDFLTSWYNVSSEIYKEINRACPEKKVLNLALSVLMFPYIVFTALGLAVYNKLKTNDKTQISSEENETKKSEVSENTAKRLAYGVFASIAVLVSIPILLLSLIPATPALATFYLTNRKLSHSLGAAFKISHGLYKNEHQNIEVFFREIDAGESDIKLDMEVKFPPQFEQLLRDLCEGTNDKLFVRRDSERNTILKLHHSIHLTNGLVPLRNEIRSVIATSIQECVKIMEELTKLEKKDITYDKLKELLNGFRLEVVNSIGPGLTSHLIQNAYQVAFIQAIKIAQREREKKGGFSLEERLKEVLVEQELKSQGKELPTEKEMIAKDLKISGNLNDEVLPVFRAERKRLIEKGEIAGRTVIDIYKEKHPQAAKETLDNAEKEMKRLKEISQTRYNNICEELRKIHESRRNGNLKNGALKRKLEDLFKPEYNDQEVEQKLIESRIRAIQTLLSKSDNKIKQSLAEDLSELNETKTSDKVNDFIEKMYLEITRYKIQELFEKQGKSVKNIEDNTGIFNEEDEKRLVNKIVSYRKKIRECSTQHTRLKEIIEEQNKDLDVEKDSKEKESASMKLIELCLKNNREILEALEQLESDKKESLINEEAKNDYKEKLTSREKIKFAIIEDDLLGVFRQETFDEEAIKKLLEKAELEYCLAEKCIKGPVIKTKDNIKHFCQDLLSPLVNSLIDLIINNVSKDDDGLLTKAKKSLSVVLGWLQLGAAPFVSSVPGVRRIYDQNLDEALKTGRNTHRQIETFLQYFESSYEEVGGLVGDVFSDDGETFKNKIWPEITNHFCGMWSRFFKDIEFKVGNKLDEVTATAFKHRAFLAEV